MNSHQIRSKIISTPVVGKVARIVKDNIKLPDTIQKINNDTLEIQERLNSNSTALAEYSQQHQQDINTIRNSLKDLRQTVEGLSDRTADLQHQLSVNRTVNSSAISVPSNTSKELLADNHLLDSFYVAFENKFRGKEDAIIETLEVYVPILKETGINFTKTPVLDIGCGRGEMLKLMRENKISAVGIDINQSMVEHVKKQGYKVILGDVIEYLGRQKNGSFGAITGFHIVEHLPFEMLMTLFSETYRTLAPGGIAIFETPNPENILVGSCNFYHDPSHLNPIPPAMLQFQISSSGFEKVEILRLHPIYENIDHEDKLLKEIAEKIFGPQDYAVIGKKVRLKK